MDQTTQATETPELTLQTGLIICHIINLILLVLSSYLFLSVFHHGCKTGSWKNRHANSPGMNRGGVYKLCFIAILLDIPRLVMTEIVINVNNIKGGKYHCEELVDASNIAHYLAAFPKYFFLWYRQHTIYSHPASTGTFSGNFARFISYTVLGIMTIISALITYFYISPFTFGGSPLGCVFEPVANQTNPIQQISKVSRDYILTAGLMLNELVLLSLFIYPLCRNQNINKKLRRNESVTLTTDRRRGFSDTMRLSYHRAGKSEDKTKSKPGMTGKAKGKSRTSSLTRLIKRSTIATAVAVTADLVVMIAANALPRNGPVVISMVIYNTRSIILSICIISTFSYFKQILMTFCVTRTQSRRTSFTSSRFIGSTETRT